MHKKFYFSENQIPSNGWVDNMQSHLPNLNGGVTTQNKTVFWVTMNYVYC